MGYTNEINKKNSVSKLEKILINKNYHWMLWRGEDISNPVILFLHGGPGNAQIGWIAEFQKDLEKEFIVVNWDQKGSGLSYNKDINFEEMNLGIFIKELEDIVIFLTKKFRKKKIYLVGHSWGAILGMHIINKRPDLFYKYISVCQPVNHQISDCISYNYALKKAYLNKEYQLAQNLIDKKNNLLNNEFEYVNYLKNMINKYSYKTNSIEILNIMKKRNEYNNDDIINWISGSYFSLKHLWKDVKNTDLFEQITRIEIPIS
ncbi:MAG: alpha/beta hydrolase, partial [Staphylococcus warneri]|nr:alpha/beta hydrolase [Staphylococcus warneri]